MSDSYSKLSQHLELILHFEKKNHDDSYRFPPVQSLYIAAQHYQDHLDKKSFIKLVKALGAMQGYFKKGVDFNEIKVCVAELATLHDLPPINWNKLAGSARVTTGFQFASQSVTDKDLISWLNLISRKNFSELNHKAQAQLLINCSKNQDGFSTKLKNHLDQHPNFLLKLALDSEENFIGIGHSRLNLFLDDKQMAQIIKHYAPAWLEKKKHLSQSERTDAVLKQISDIVTYKGRSITKLLANPNVKNVLKDTEFYKNYQEHEYQQHLQHTSGRPR